MLRDRAPSARRDRLAISFVFCVHGTVTGTYSSRLPWIKDHVHASTGVLGAAMISLTIGAMIIDTDALLPPRAPIGARRAAQRLLTLMGWTGASPGYPRR